MIIVGWNMNKSRSIMETGVYFVWIDSLTGTIGLHYWKDLMASAFYPFHHRPWNWRSSTGSHTSILGWFLAHWGCRRIQPWTTSGMRTFLLSPLYCLAVRCCSMWFAIGLWASSLQVWGWSFHWYSQHHHPNPKLDPSTCLHRHPWNLLAE